MLLVRVRDQGENQTQGQGQFQEVCSSVDGEVAVSEHATYKIIYFRPRGDSIPNMYKQQDDDMLARATVETWVIKAEKGDRDCCPKCDGRVFEAEKMVTASVNIYLIIQLKFLSIYF